MRGKPVSADMCAFPLAQSDDEVDALTMEAGPSAPQAAASDSPSAQALPNSSSSNSLQAAAGLSPAPPMSDGEGSSAAVSPVDVAAAARASAATAAGCGEGSDGDSPRYSAHPATMQTIKQPAAAAGGGGGSPASSNGTNSPSVAAATAARSAGFKMTATSWLQGGKGSDVTGSRTGSAEAGSRPSALGRTGSNASADGATPVSPASSRASRGGDTAFSDWHPEGVPGPSPLGLGSGRLTANQAAAAARILMAGGKLPGSPTTQTDSPFAKAQHADGGHISFSGSSRGRSVSEGPPARTAMQGRLGAAVAQQPVGGVQDEVSSPPGPGSDLGAPLEGLGFVLQPPPRNRSETSMSRIAEEVAVASAAAGAVSEQWPPPQTLAHVLQHASDDSADCSVQQDAMALGSNRADALVPGTG